MAWIDMRRFLESIRDQLQPEDLDGLKYVLTENFTGKFHSNFAASSPRLFKVFGCEIMSWFS